MTRHYLDLGITSDWSCLVRNWIQPVSSTTVSQTSFGGELRLCLCWLFFLFLIFSVFFTSLNFFGVFRDFVSLFLLFTTEKNKMKKKKWKKNEQLRMVFASDGVGVVIRIKSAEPKI